VREEINSYRFGKLKERDLLEYSGSKWRIILKLILRHIVR
jgi:hypothetical protein